MALAIMIQGTMSNVGKSLIAAGLCRIFKQDGYRVAPFKSQNMALNSYITDEGLEMGRAQVVQAEACGIRPRVSMNPILLKPTTDMGSQVIVRGEIVGDMHAVDYFRRKKEYIPVIRECYQELANEYDIIVIEGAGSPAELNLKQDDIVNMGMAELADAPVLLVGDIDRGGVFAQLIGTVMLLEPREQDRIKGLIINKFRGDRDILTPGLDMLTERCGKPVFGVVPYMTGLDIEDEDSLAGRLSVKAGGAEGTVDIVVIRLPKISNFTDFQALALEDRLSVRYVGRADELGHPDMIILPGTKSTSADMLWMRTVGLEAEIIRLAHEGTIIFGICGGYQMLGREIIEQEDTRQMVRGMNLLPVVTYFKPEKTRAKVTGSVEKLNGVLSALSGRHISGYEIHMGQSEPVEPLGDQGKCSYFSSVELLKEAGHGVDRQRKEGCCADNVFGTYLHGIFDGEDFRQGIAGILCERKGIARLTAGKTVSGVQDMQNMQDVQGVAPTLSYAEYKERQINALAAALRDSLDMKAIYAVLGI